MAHYLPAERRIVSRSISNELHDGNSDQIPQRVAEAAAARESWLVTVSCWNVDIMNRRSMKRERGKRFTVPEIIIL